jgi:hypothetical protein
LLKKIITFLVILIIVIGGYFLFFHDEKNIDTTTKITPKGAILNRPNSITSNNLQSLIKKAIHAQYTGKVTSIKITETLNIENGTFVSFLLEKEDYFGVLYASKNDEKYKLNDIELTKKNKNEKLNVMQILGDTEEQPKRNYRIVTGVINDKIDSIHIFYPDGEYFIIKLDGKQKNFLNVRVGNTDAPVKISGKLKDKEIYSINY